MKELESKIEMAEADLELLLCHVIPQQRKLMGSSAQIAPVCAGAGRRSWFRRKVPEGSGGFWRVPGCAGVSSGGRFQKVPERFGEFRCRFRREVPEHSAGFRCVVV